LTATPAANYSFSSWSGDITSTSNPVTVTMDAAKNITANFVLDTHALNITATNGTVAKSPNKAVYNHGEQVVLTATPAANYSFSSWSGDITSTSNPVTVTMDAAKNITANFLPALTATISSASGSPNGPVVSVPVTVGDLGNRQIISVDMVLNYDPSVIQAVSVEKGAITSSWNVLGNTQTAGIVRIACFGVEKLASSGGELIKVNFQVNGSALAGAKSNLSLTSVKFNSLDAEKINNGEFTVLDPLTCKLTINRSGQGKITPDLGVHTYKIGETVTLTAQADTGYNFTGWSNDAAGTANPLEVTMDKDKVVTANFVLNQYTLTIVSSHGTVVKDPEQAAYGHGSSVKLTAAASSGYKFSSWSGDVIGTANPVTVSMDNNKTVTANYEPVLTVNVSSTSAHPGDLQIPVVISVGNLGAREIISTDLVLNYNKDLLQAVSVEKGALTSAWSVVANTKIAGTVNIASFGSEKLDAQGGELLKIIFNVKTSAQAGAKGSLALATAKFNTTKAEQINNGEFTILSAITYNLVISKNGEGSVSPEVGTHVYVKGEVVSVQASAADGYYFTGWSNGSSGTANPLEVTMDQDRAITANFIDNTAPSGASIIINNRDNYTNNRRVTLNISGFDAGSGISKMSLSEDGSTWLAQEAYSQTRIFNLTSAGDGQKSVYVKLFDAAGNESEVSSDTIILDTTAPQVLTVDDYPKRTKDAELKLSGTKESGTSILINGSEKVALNNQTIWNTTVGLQEGKNTLTIVSRDAASNEMSVSIVVTLKTKVNIHIIWPPRRLLRLLDIIPGQKEISVLYTVDDNQTIKAKRVTLEESKEIKEKIIESDDLGNTGEAEVALMFDSIPPAITILSHQKGQKVIQSKVTIFGKAEESGSGVQYVKVNGIPAVVTGDQFTTEVNLASGVNNVSIEATDNAGNSGVAVLDLDCEVAATTTTSSGATNTASSSGGTAVYIVPTSNTSVQSNTPSSTVVSTSKPNTNIVSQKDIDHGYESYQNNKQEQSTVTTSYSPSEAYQRQATEESQPKVTLLASDKSSKEVTVPVEEVEEPIDATASLAPEIKASEMTKFFIWRAYKLTIKNIEDKPVSWKLPLGQELPFLLELNEKKGVIQGFVWGKKELELRLRVTTSSGQIKEVKCKLTVQ
jgi:uncharacterized repeat protein (TIGR02543 family)